MHFDYLIIGSGIAGISAAETLRKKGGDEISIGLISDEPHTPYSKVLLPFWIKGKIPREKLFIRSNDFWKKSQINFIFGEVNKLDKSNKKVIVNNGEEIFYSKLLIASGARARRMNFLGSNLHGVFYFRNLDEAESIKNYLEQLNNLQPAIYGSSFIALEFAGIFSYFGIGAKIFFRGPYFWHKLLDKRGGELIENFLEQAGMKLYRNEEIRQIRHMRQGDQIGELITSKNKYECNFLGMGIGLKPNFDFASDAGLRTNDGITVNEFLQSDNQDIFAAGDVAEFYDLTIGRHHTLGNWLNSDMQGRCAAFNMLGQSKKFELVSSYSFSFEGNKGKNNAGKFDICAIGDTSPEAPFESKIELKNQAYSKIFYKNNKPIGAILINRNDLRMVITSAIKTSRSLTA